MLVEGPRDCEIRILEMVFIENGIGSDINIAKHSISEIARRNRITRTGLNTHLNSLDKMGYIYFEKFDRDNKSKIPIITDKGTKALKENSPVINLLYKIKEEARAAEEALGIKR